MIRFCILVHAIYNTSSSKHYKKTVLLHRKLCDAAVSFDTYCVGIILIISLRIELQVVVFSGDSVAVLSAKVTDSFT